ncbi:MAG: beta-ketoacyl synthase [Pseudomonadales bacterium]
MARLPLIVGFGGINPAGRSSSLHSYRRMVIDALDAKSANETWQSLAQIMGIEGALDAHKIQWMTEHTLIRELEDNLFHGHAIPWNRKMRVSPVGDGINFEIPKRQLPSHLPDTWHVKESDNGNVLVNFTGISDVLVEDRRKSDVCSAGQLPTGFKPEDLYNARSHPRGLQMAIYAASDALGDLGIPWQTIVDTVNPDQIAVYAGSAMAQQDEYGNKGMLAARDRGDRVSSKNLALGLAEMPADFVNAYILGNLGTTGLNMGACATFHYNLRQGVHDILAGRARVVIVGGSEAGITPEVMDGYATMGALATDKALMALDGLTEGKPDYRRASRPFADNCGFTIAEAAQYTVLMDDELAMELGAQVYGMVPDVFVNADGYKKSISSPGVGNYITVAKSVAMARAIVGEEALRRRSFIHAHGTSTPQNRVTESQIFNETAKTFGIESWPVAAVKSYLGHTIAVAGADQLMASLGTWRHGILPGILTMDKPADDVQRSNLSLSNQHQDIGQTAMDVSFLNAKGFGGNNATATVLGPHVAEQMLLKKHGKAAVHTWMERRETTESASDAYDKAATAGTAEVVYRFNHQVRDDSHIHMSEDTVRVDGYCNPIMLPTESPFSSLLKK